MIMEELREYYGTWAAMGRALGMSSTTYLSWVKNGFIPWTTQCVIEKITNKKFIAKKEHAKPQKPTN